jgi:two-component system sensor histidine kinase LytS
MLLAQPYEKALAMEKAIALPTTIVSVVGTIIFIVILKNIREEQSLYGAKAAEQALDIATQALPYARQGLNEDSAGMIAGIIHDITNMDAVAVTDREKIIAFIGAGADHQYRRASHCRPGY